MCIQLYGSFFLYRQDYFIKFTSAGDDSDMRCSVHNAALV